MSEFLIPDFLSNVITSAMAIPVLLWFLTPKFKRSTTVIIATGYCIIVSLFFMHLSVFLNNNNITALSDIIAFLFVIPFAFLFKDRIVNKLIVVLSIKIGATIISLPPLLILRSLNMLDTSTIQGVIISSATITAFFLIVSRLIYLIVTKSLRKSHFTKVLLVFIPSFIWIDLSSLYPTFIVTPYKQIENVNNILETVFTNSSVSIITYLLAIISLIISFYIAIKYFELQQLKQLELELQNKEKLNNEYCEIVLENEKRAKTIQQSLNTELDKMIKCIENNQALEIENNNIKEEINRITAVKFCDNKTINAILVSKYTLALKSNCNIKLSVNLDNNTKIEEYDLLKVIFNIFDNAINATQILDDKERYIKFVINTTDNSLNIYCENTFNQDNIHLKNDEHGYGIIIIRDIAQKYSGHFNTSVNGNRFICTFVV